MRALLNKLFQQSAGLGTEQLGSVMSLQRALNLIPEHLLPMLADDRLRFEACIAHLDALVRSHAAYQLNGPTGPWHNGFAVRGFEDEPEDRRGLVKMLDSVLANVPDEAPRHDDQRLAFIEYPDHRSDLLTDWDTAGRLMSHGMWKASTVMSGTVIEALLVVAVQQWCAARVAADPKARELHDRVIETSCTAPKLADIAHRERLISCDTNDLLETYVFPYRNLIHKARSMREGVSAGPNTAHIAFGAVDQVVGEVADALRKIGKPPT